MSTTRIHERTVEEVLGRVSDAFMALDENWQFTYVNEQAEQLLERSRDELIGDELWDHFPHAKGSRFHEQYRAAMEQREARTFEEFYEPLETWFRVDVYPADDGLSVYFEDITDERRRVRELERYARAIETMGDGVYVVDSEGRFTMVNEAYAKMLGYTRDELVGNPVTDFVDEEMHEEAEQLVAELRESDQETVTKEARLERSDGDYVIAEAAFSLMETDHGEERVAVVRDVTDRKERQEQLAEHRDMLAEHVDRTELIQRINQGILGANSQERIRETVCEVLADSEFYQVAWIGHRVDGELTLQSGAGTSRSGLEALVEAAIRDGGLGPVGRAIERRAIQVQQHIEDDPTDPRFDIFAERGYHSSISLPLVHDGTLLGVLTMDSDRTHAFTGFERELLANLADTVAYAMQTVEERRRFRSVVDDVLETSVGAGIILYDEAGRVQWVNERAEQFFGLSPGAIEGLDGETVLTDHLAPTFEDPVTAVGPEEWLAETGGTPSEYHIRGDGSRESRHLERRCSPIETGLYAGGSVALYYDITGRKESERRLAESERQRRTLLENLPGMAYRCRDEPGWPMEFVSQGCTDVTGYQPAQLEHDEVSWGADVVHDEDREMVRDAIQSATEADEPYEVTYRIVTADGETRWVWEQGQEITTLDGEQRLEGFLTDVTERRRRREELRRQNELNRQLFETSPIAILAFRGDGTLARANERAIDGLGLDTDDPTDYDVGGMTVYDEDGTEIPPDERPIYRTLESGETVTGKTIGVEADDGQMRWFSYQSAPVFDDGGDVEMAVVSCDDITESKRRQTELRRLDHVNTVIRRLNRTLVESDDHPSVRETVCSELAAADPYGAAWYCDVDLAADELVPVATAGLDAPPEDVAIPVDETLAGDAVRSGEVTVGQFPADHLFADAIPMEVDGARLKTVPVSYAESQYGVLCLAADDQWPFTAELREVFAELGDSIGHALTAIDRREGLLVDSATRLEFRVRNHLTENVDTGLDFDTDSLTYEFDKTIVVGDGTVVQYLSVAETATGELTDLLAASDDVTEYRRLDDDADAADADGDAVRYEVKQHEPPLVEALTELGGRIVSVDLADDDLHVVTELPTTTDTRQVVDRVRDIHPSVDLEAQRSVSVDRQTPRQQGRLVLDELTDRQSTVLETAYFAGYFEWPRATTGEEVAETLELSPSTFSQHLRAGQRKTFASIFEAE